MKTVVYVDGYNFYYGCLKGTHYKWVDLYKLFDTQVLSGNIPAELTPSSLSIKYYTANILGCTAKCPSSLRDQDAYHRALERHYESAQLSIHKGYYTKNKVRAPFIDPKGPDKPAPKDCEQVPIWKLEEKQTDVKLAVDALYDVFTIEDLEHVVFVTNDTDMEPALERIKSLSRVKISVVTPTRDQCRPASEKLTNLADWVRNHISDKQLNQAQLPLSIPGGKKPIQKPISWYRYPQKVELLIQILDEAHRGRRNQTWRWLNQTPIVVKGLPELPDPAIALLDCESTISDVIVHAKAYRAHKLSL